MDFIISNQKRMSVKLQRLLMIMVAIIVASMTITACWDDEDDENGDGNGNSGGGVAGKRIKSWVITCSKPVDGIVKTDYSYNSDGTLRRTDGYDSSSKLYMYTIFTSNSDGMWEKYVQHYETMPLRVEFNFSYNSNKILQKCQFNTFSGGVLVQTANIDYTFENGRKTLEVYTISGSAADAQYSFNYSNGRRTTSTYTTYVGSQVYTMTYTRTYNSDGTLQKVTYPLSVTDNTLVTQTYTWENGKTTVDHDLYSPI